MAKKPQPTTPTEIPLPKVLRAFRPGDVVFLECPKPLSNDQMQHLHAEFKKRIPEVKVCILQAGIKVAARAEEQPDEDLDTYRALARTVREFLEHLRLSHEAPTQIENPRAELGLLLALQEAVRMVP